MDIRGRRININDIAAAFSNSIDDDASDRGWGLFLLICGNIDYFTILYSN